MKRHLAFASITAVLFFFMTAPALAQISLGSASNFGVLGGSAVTNTGPTTVSGNVGVSPGSSVTGFPPGVVVGGTIHSNDAVAQQAQNDLTTAYNEIAATPCTVDLTGQNLGGLTLTPGVYCFATSAQLTGALSLDALGNPNALFLFKIGSTLTTASGSSVSVINGGSACDSVYWQVGSSATIGTNTNFAGDILALTSITLTTGADTSGRALARNGAVTLDSNTVNSCGVLVCPIITVNPASLPNGTVGTAYNQNITATGGTAPYTFGVSSGALPAGLTLNPATGALTGIPTAAGTFNFSITATDATGCRGTRLYSMTIALAGCPLITLSPSTLPPGQAGAAYSQQITASADDSSDSRNPVAEGIAPSTFTYTIAGGALPPGFTLNPATGLISGTTAQTGLFSFRVRATDTAGCVGEAPYTITVLAANVGIPTLGSWMLMLLVALIGVAGAFSVNRFMT